MRKVKFRGRDFAGLWHIGDLIHNDDDLLIRNGCLSTYIENETAGQFTGLLDKNGKEIYEGDIVRGNCGNGEVRHLISFYDMIASFVAEILPDNDINDYCALSQIWILKYNKEVIGNIHDNPELLKGDKR